MAQNLVLTFAAEVADPEELRKDIDALLKRHEARVLGHVYSIAYETARANAEGVPMYIYATSNMEDDEAFSKVDGLGEDAPQGVDVAVSAEDTDDRVITAIHLKYPSADRYGAPLASANEEFMKALAAEVFGLPVAPDAEAYSEDRNDDGVEEYWVEIKPRAATD